MTYTIKNYLGIAGIIALGAVSIGVLWGAYAYSDTNEPDNYRSFTVTAESEQVVIPDLATFSFQVITEGNTTDLGRLQQQNSEQTSSVVSYLKEQGIAEEDIKTTQYRINPRYRYFDCGPRPLYLERGISNLSAETCPPPEIVGYTITEGIEVKIRDFEKLGSLVSGAVENGANQISNVIFSVEHPEEVRDQIRAAAIEKARERAQSVAQAGGFKVGKLISLTESGSTPPIHYGRTSFDGALEESASAALPPGSQEITVSVNLEYEIDD